jgi:hypothetical protein
MRPYRSLLASCLLLVAGRARAEEELAPIPAAEEAPIVDEAPVMRTKLYGFLDALVEKEWDAPTGVSESGETMTETSPHEFDVPNLNVMTQASYGHFRGFINLKAVGGEGLEVRNAWIEAAIGGDLLAVRAGKLYRPFGLYNEVLDAVPTYIGIEPPELFDRDHLILTRTTNLMLHGAYATGAHRIGYALTTGNDERAGSEVPLGADLNYSLSGLLKIGASFYSSMGDAAPTVAVGEGPPQGGVLPWMESDEFMVYGGYLQLNWDALLVQAEYWEAPHHAKRDPEAVAALARTGLNARQRRRFGIDDSGSPPDPSTLRVNADYTVRTWYTRLGYTIESEMLGEVVPYFQYDWYKSAETVREKEVGGDDEAGLSDSGEFFKLTVGVVFRPVSSVALKIDVSDHARQFNGELVQNPEVRMNLSYLWSLQ